MFLKTCLILSLPCVSQSLFLNEEEFQIKSSCFVSDAGQSQLCPALSLSSQESAHVRNTGVSEGAGVSCSVPIGLGEVIQKGVAVPS